ncbi:MAG: putative DNA binding domain-containing protein [Dehalococcoidia bacterium]|nr:putative DNA binding domain-containing protein [Dehalococcoidia bacterium]
MTRDEIANLVAEGESETLEFKKTTGERAEAAKTACAMLNRRGGVVLIGVTKAGTITGQEVGDGTIERVAEELRNIDPPVFPAIDRVPIGNGKTVLMIQVGRGAMRPYAHRNIPYQKVGNTTRRMTQEEYSQTLLERMHNEQRWENQPAVDCSIDDLDLAELRRTVVESIRMSRGDPGTFNTEEVLLGMGLIKDGAQQRAAVALFGNNQRIASEWTQCLLRVARFQGIDRTEFLDNRQFRGNAFTLLTQAERFIQEHLPIAGRITMDSFVRVDEPLYPPLALREALANALCHRDYTSGGGSVAVGIYDDRLEITSIGPLHFGLTPELLFLPHEPRPWNPLIANAFYRRGIIEQWGRGTIKMAELTAAAGLPRPEIEDNADFVTIRFRPSRYVPPQRVGHDLTERQRVILALLDESSAGLALREILAHLEPDASRRQVQLDLSTLRTLNLVEIWGQGWTARWRRL